MNHDTPARHERREPRPREYVGLIWIGDAPGIRFRLMAMGPEEARRQVIDHYGEGHVFTLKNEEDAARPR